MPDCRLVIGEHYDQNIIGRAGEQTRHLTLQRLSVVLPRLKKSLVAFVVGW